MGIQFLLQRQTSPVVNTQFFGENFTPAKNGFLNVIFSTNTSSTLGMTTFGNGEAYVNLETLNYTGLTSGASDGAGTATVASSVLTAASFGTPGTDYIDGEQIIIEGAGGANGAIATITASSGEITGITIIDGVTLPVQLVVQGANAFRVMNIPITTGFEYNLELTGGSLHNLFIYFTPTN